MTASKRRSSASPACAAAARVGHRHVEPGGDELLAHPIGADGEDGVDLGRVAAQVLHRRPGRGHDLVAGCRDAHAAETLDIASARHGRVVGRETDGDAAPVEPADKLRRAGDRIRAPVDHAVEIEDDEAHASGQVGHPADHSGEAAPARHVPASP